MAIIDKTDISELSLIVIDGYVYSDNERSSGLSGFLWENLNKKIPVIGLAKSAFYQNDERAKKYSEGKANYRFLFRQ